METTERNYMEVRLKGGPKDFGHGLTMQIIGQLKENLLGEMDREELEEFYSGMLLGLVEHFSADLGITQVSQTLFRIHLNAAAHADDFGETLQ